MYVARWPGSLTELDLAYYTGPYNFNVTIVSTNNILQLCNHGDSITDSDSAGDHIKV